MRSPLPSGGEGGFTLLETLVALTIMAMSLVWILKGQTDSIVRNIEARMYLQGVHLANYKILEIEQLLRKEGFGTFEGELCGDFESDQLDGTESFNYCVYIEKILMPDMSMLQQQMASGLGLDDESGTGGGATGDLPPLMQDLISQLIPDGGGDLLSGLGGMMGNILSMALSGIQNVMEQAVRRVRVVVAWRVGRKERSYELIAFFADPAVLDQNILDLTAPIGGVQGGQGGQSGGRVP